MIVDKLMGLGSIVTLAAGLTMMIPTMAVAAPDDCFCIVSAPISGPVGSVSPAQGDVFLLGASGPAAISVPADLQAVSELMTGANGSALASVAGCSVALGASMKMTITPIENQQLCVRVLDDSLVADAPSSSDLTVPLAAGGAVGLAGAALLLVDTGDSDPDSL